MIPNGEWESSWLPVHVQLVSRDAWLGAQQHGSSNTMVLALQDSIAACMQLALPEGLSHSTIDFPAIIRDTEDQVHLRADCVIPQVWVVPVISQACTN